jgi:hypothetical protein
MSFACFQYSEKLDVLLASLKFPTSLLLLALTVVTGISAVTGYICFFKLPAVVPYYCRSGLSSDPIVTDVLAV